MVGRLRAPGRKCGRYIISKLLTLSQNGPLSIFLMVLDLCHTDLVAGDLQVVRSEDGLA